jgi:hypothetical protein
MTTEMENELRELFREKAGEPPIATPVAARQRVLRRGRRHQVGTVLGSAAVALLVAAGSFAGLRSLLRDSDTFETGQEYDVFERTATIEAFTVTSPSDWFLVNGWPLSMQMAVGSGSASKECTVGVEPPVCTGDEETNVQPLPSGLPMFQLSNSDMGLTTNACGEGEGLASDAAVLYVALDYQRSIEGVTDPTARPWPGIATEENGACGPGSYARFTVNREPFFAWIGFGDRVSEDDRSSLLATYESLVVDDSWEPIPPDDVTPAYVIAGGTVPSGEEWRLELRPGALNVRLTLEGTMPGGGADGWVVPEKPVDACCQDPDGFWPVAFGAIRKGATGVEMWPSDGSDPIPGTIVPLPPTLPFDFDLFFIEDVGGLAGDVVALGIEDGGTTSPSPIVETRAGIVSLSGAYGGRTWIVRFTGAFADGTACIGVQHGGEPLGRTCPRPLDTSLAGDQPSLHVVNTAHLALIVGSVPPDVVEVRFTSDSGINTPSQFQCQMGPLGWTGPDRKVCVLALPPEDSGTFTYLGTTGEVLFEEGMGWGASEPDVFVPMPVDPVHGGTYWGVYAWVGAAGDREADDVSAWLLERFGIEAHPGDLACDEGAAKALGTDAEQGIAVYFETEDKAADFALRAGLLDHTNPMIARVTTFCLD